MQANIHAACCEGWRGADRIGGRIDDRAEARKARLSRDQEHGRRGPRRTRQTGSRVKQAPRKAVANNSRLGQQGDNAVGAPKERGGWTLGRKGRGGMAGRAVLSMAVWGIGMGGMHCRHEQWPSNGQGPYDATRGGFGGVRIGEAKTPGPYSEGGATSSGLGGMASSQKVGAGRAGQQGGRVGRGWFAQR